MLILATDMARHNEILDAFKSQISQGFDFAKEEAVNAVNCFYIFNSHFFSVTYKNRVRVNGNLCHVLSVLTQRKFHACKICYGNWKDPHVLKEAMSSHVSHVLVYKCDVIALAL